MPFQPTTASEDEHDPMKKIPMTSYPLEKLESNVAQTWSSLEVLSQDFAQMWEQIEKLESIMSLQRQIISTVNEPYSPVTSQNNFSDVSSKPSSDELGSRFPYNIPLVSKTESHYSWSEFFNMPSMMEDYSETSTTSTSALLDQYESPSHNNLNKGDIPTIRFQTYCDCNDNDDNVEQFVGDEKFEKHIDTFSIQDARLDHSSSENNEFCEDQSLYKSRVETGSQLNKSSSEVFVTSLAKSQSWLGLDNAFRNDLHVDPTPRMYYSPQPKRKSTSQSARVGYSCPRLDSCTNGSVSPASSIGYMSRATECSSLSRSDYCSPVDLRYTNPFLQDLEAEMDCVENLIGSGNFIVKPRENQSVYDNVIEALAHFQEEPAPPESPPPPAPQDNRSYGYYTQDEPLYDYYDNDLRYEYVEPICSTSVALDGTNDSDTEDIISKIDYLYENELQHRNQQQSKWATPHTSYYQSPITGETLDLIDRLQENYQLRNMLASAKYKSWTNIPQERVDSVASTNKRSSMLQLTANKSGDRYAPVGSTDPVKISGVLPRGRNYGSTHEFRGSKSRLQEMRKTNIEVTSPTKGLASHAPTVYSLASNDQYTSVYASGVGKYEPSECKPISRSRTPDLINVRQWQLDKHEMAKNFPTHSYQPEVTPSSGLETGTAPTPMQKRSDSTAMFHPRNRFLTNGETASQFVPATCAPSATAVPGSTYVNYYSDVNRKCTETKKGRRGTLRSAFSVVGSSVSHWMPSFHLMQRRHSFPAPFRMSKDDRSGIPTTPKKKKHSIISMMTGMFHKAQKSSSNSTDSESEAAWSNAHAYEDVEDVFVENQYFSQYPDVTKGVKNPTSISTMTANTRPFILPERSQLPKMEEKTSDEGKEEVESERREEKENLDYQTAETPTLAEPINDEATMKRYATNPIISIDSFEDKEICSIEDEKSTSESKTLDLSVTPRRSLPKQFSLDVSQGFLNDDAKDDIKSNHSWCSTMSKTSSRRQSTEESIDTEDEWYMYEFRKLENLEKQTDQRSSVIENADEQEAGDKEYVDSDFNKSSVDAEETTEYGSKAMDDHHSLSVMDTVENVCISSGETSEPDSPCQNLEETFKEDETKVAQPILDEERTCETTVDGILVQEEEEEEEGKEENLEQQQLEIEIEEGGDDAEEAQVAKMEEEEDKIPGTPSLPRFRYDKSESAESPHASKEEISKDGLGSKWKLIKALKERKAEEKSKEAEPPPPAVSTFFSFF